MSKRGGSAAETIEFENVTRDGETPADNDLVAIEESILAAADATEKNVTWDIRIYKLDKAAGNAEEYMFSVLPSELDGLFERVRDSEGTGTYRMRAYRKIGGKNAVFKQSDFRIRAPLKPIAPVEKPSELAAILAAMKEQAERNERLLREVLTTRVQPDPVQRNPFDDLEKLTNIIKNLQPDIPQMHQQPQQDLTQVFVKGVEFAEKIVGDKGGGETNLWDIAKAVISNLPAVAALAQVQTNRQLQPRPGQVKPSVVVSPANPQPVAPPRPQMTDQQSAVKELLQYMLTRAQRNSEAGVYADWVIDNVDGEIITFILSQPDPIMAATVLEPRVANYRPWFEELIAELRQLVNMQRNHTAADDDAPGSDAETDVPHDNPRRGGRDSVHPANNVTLGQGWKKETDHT
jgi:hypothetical protein